MIKYKTFYSTHDDRYGHDKEVQLFLAELSECGHTFISVNTVMYGTSSGYLNRFRTEITYRENQTRKVLIEKKND